MGKYRDSRILRLGREKMEEIVLRVILAALLVLSWQSRPGMAGCEEYEQIPGMAKLQGETGAE